jgi:hypothetical protein
VPAIIDSAPDCIIHISGAKPADDSADFILQAAYLKCQGFATFGPGSTYGEDGSAATTAYYVLTWLGIVVTILRGSDPWLKSAGGRSSSRRSRLTSRASSLR